MLYFILRFIFICFVSYFVGIEAGWYTAAAIMVIAVEIEFIKWVIRDNTSHHQKEIRKLQLEAADDRLRIKALEEIRTAEKEFTDFLKRSAL